MTDLTLMTSAQNPSVALPSLVLLSHRVRVIALQASSLVHLPNQTILFIDGREQLPLAKSMCQIVHDSHPHIPVLLIVNEGGFTVISSQWHIADVIVDHASPAEVQARLRLITERTEQRAADGPSIGAMSSMAINSDDSVIRVADMVLDMKAYTASIHGRPIDLAYREFELLKYFIAHPGMVFTRSQILQEVWGFDYYGGNRTVDVHVRRLRAKLGGEYEQCISTVRNVGYRFDSPTHRSVSHDDRQEADADNAVGDE